MIDVNGSEIGFRRKLTLQPQTCGSCIFHVKILYHICVILNYFSNIENYSSSGIFIYLAEF